MTVLIRILELDVPHYSRTILRFFNNALAATSGHTREFMVADKGDGLGNSCPALSTQFFPGKKSLAEAAIAKTKANRQQRSSFHSQFNSKPWLALLSGGIKPSQFFWHTRGADLHELSSGLRYKLFYPLRHLAQKRVGCVFVTHGGLSFFAKTHPKVRRELLYFPIRMDPSSNTVADDRRCEGKMTILVRNSGDRSNERTVALYAIRQQLGDTVKVVVSMGYPPNNEAYIEKVRQTGLELFSEEDLRVLGEKLGPDAYLTLLRQCDLGYFIFARQQDIGTFCLLIQAGIPCIFNRENSLWQDMTEQHLPVLFTTDGLNGDIVREAQRQLVLVDKNTIASSNSNYL